MDILYKRLQERLDKNHSGRKITDLFSESALQDIGYILKDGTWANKKYASKEEWLNKADKKEIISALQKYSRKAKIHFVYWLDKHNATHDNKLEAPSTDEVNYLTFIYGGKGAVRKLARKQEKELAANIEIHKAETSKPVKYTVVNNTELMVKPAVISPEINDERIYEKTLQTVYVTAKDNKFGSGKTLEQINSETQNTINSYFRENGKISPKKALRMVDRLVGRDNVAIKISEEDCEVIIGKPVTQMNFNAVMPLLKLYSVSSYNIIKDKYGPDGGEVQLKANTGAFSPEERFIMAYYARNKTLPFDDKTGLVKNAEYKAGGKNNDGYMLLSFNVSAETIKQYLPKLEEKERNKIADKKLEVKFKPEFTRESYDSWKNNAHGKNMLAEGELKYQHSNRTISMMDAEKLYINLNKIYGFDLEAVNAALAEWKNVSIAGFREQIVKIFLDKRDIKLDADTYQNIMNDANIPAALKEQAKKDLEAQNLKLNNSIEETKENIEYLSKFSDTKSKTEKSLIKILTKAEKLKLEELYIDQALLSGNKEKAKELTEKYISHNKETTASIANKYSGKKIENIIALIDNAAHRYSSITEIAGTISNNRQFIKNLSVSGSSFDDLQKALEHSTIANEYYNKLTVGVNAASLSGGGTSVTPNISFNNSDIKGKLDYKIGSNISSAFIFNSATGNKIQKPLVDFDNYGQMKQSIKLGSELHLNSKTSLVAATSYTNDQAGKILDISTGIKKHNNNSNSWSISAFNSYLDIAENRTYLPAGLKLDSSKKFLFSGSSLVTSISTGYSPFAKYEFAGTGKTPANFYDISANISYSAKNFNAAVFADNRKTEAKDLPKHFNMLMVGGNLNYNFNPASSLDFKATMVAADGFKMTKIGSAFEFNLFKLPTTIYSNLTNIKITAFSGNMKQELLELGLKLASKNGKTHFEFKHINRLNGNLNSYTPYNIGISQDLINKGN